MVTEFLQSQESACLEMSERGASVFLGELAVVFLSQMYMSESEVESSMSVRACKSEIILH